MIALLCSIIATAFSKRRYKASQFLPKWDRLASEQSVEDMIDELELRIPRKD